MELPSTPVDNELNLYERQLADVESALGRLDDGSYGTCGVCGQPIDDAELAATPAARTHQAHQNT
jgi:DnaK suppressor protein